MANLHNISTKIHENKSIENDYTKFLPENYELDETTRKAYNAITVDKKQLVFLTGRAGTGKSTFINYLRSHYGANTVVLTPTGMTALNIHGQTIHSFFRFPPRTFENEDITQKHNNVIDKLDLIIIDEISMVQSDLIDHIDFALRKWRNSDKPFAGIQLLLVGDCFQLSPWIKFGAEKKRYEEKYKSQWFFDADVFQKVDVEPLNLTKVYRQSDPYFTKILNHIRIKYNYSDYIKEINDRCYYNPSSESDSEQLVLTTTNQQADSINAKKLNAITSDSVSFSAVKEGTITAEITKIIPETLVLKVGAQVVVTKNIQDAKNGTIAIVKELLPNKVIIEDLSTKKTIECVEETWEQFNYNWDDETKKISSVKTGQYKQIPLRLGWAITIHKSQGLTFDSIQIDLSQGVFAPGQTYVALSRCRSLERITLTQPIKEKDIIIDEHIYKFYTALFDQQKKGV